jgi:hypothetical protein
MEELEMLEQTNETENVETETTEEIQDEGIEITDTPEVEDTEETQEVKKTLKQLLSEDEEYQKQFNTMMQTRLERVERKHQREMAGYKDVDNVLRKTLNIGEDADVSQELRRYYDSEGVELPERYTPGLSSREIEALAQIEVSEIEEDGHEAMVTEANRLATIGYKNLNERDKIIFNSLAEKLTKEKELLKLGAKKDLLKDEDFKEFRKNFSSNASLEFVYGLYANQKPKKQYETAGSMKNISVDNKKTIFTDEDILKMTDEELEANWDAIRKYQTQQK